jgi:uncharacterized RDD family membrane protein YckC
MSRPALVDGRDPTRVVTRRCIALLVDALLLAALPAVTVLVVGRADLRKGDCPDPLPSGRDCIAFKQQVMLIDKGSFLLFVGLLALLYLVAFVAVQGVTGASPGKALLGIRVVRSDGTPAGTLRSLIRLAAWVVDGIALLLPIALWSAWLTPGHRRVGDWVAGTYVVRSRARPSREHPGADVVAERG